MAVFCSQDEQWEGTLVILLGTLSRHVTGEIGARPAGTKLLKTNRRYTTPGANSFGVTISQQELRLDVTSIG